MSQRFFLHANDAGRDLVETNLHAFINRLPKDKPWVCVIDKLVKKRSPKQRKALFAAAYGPIMEFMGLRGEDDKNELHRFFCRKYFGEREDSIGRILPARTTTKNEQGEREEISMQTALDFYQFIQQFAAEQGIHVPDPDPQWRENAEREKTT